MGIFIMQFLFRFTLLRRLAAMDGFCDYIIFGRITHPEEYMFYGAVFVEGHADYVFKTLKKVFGTFCVFFIGKRFYLVNPIKGEGKDFAFTIRRTKEKPTVVILLQQIRMEIYATDGRIGKGVIGKTDDHLVGYIIKESTQQIGV